MILVDEAVWPWRGRRWAHLVSDESYDELHAFANRLGMPRRAFQGDHYDVPADLRERAIELGATPVGSRDLVRRLRAAGLRRRGGGERDPAAAVNSSLRRYLDAQAVPDHSTWAFGGYELHTHPDLLERLEQLAPGWLEVVPMAGVAVLVVDGRVASAVALGTSTLLVRAGTPIDGLEPGTPIDELAPDWVAVNAWQSDIVRAEGTARLAAALAASATIAQNLLT